MDKIEEAFKLAEDKTCKNERRHGMIDLHFFGKMKDFISALHK